MRAATAWVGGQLREAVRASPTPAHAVLWAPVAFAAGAAAYFGLGAEPPGWSGTVALAATAGLLAAALILRVQARLWFMLILCAALAAGYARAHHRTHAAGQPPVAASTEARSFEGWIETVQRARGRDRLIIRVSRLQGVDNAPRRIRVLAAREDFQPGDYVRGRAVLGPPPRPVAPGGYDGQFAAWFDGLGATGYAIAPLQAAEAGAGQDRFARALSRLRWTLAERVRSQSPERTGGVAAALVTGDRSGITPQAAEALRNSGLGHILAISGLHMALFAGGVFFFVSALIAAVEPLGRRIDSRRPAALIALICAAAYLVLTGAAIPTQRAFIMAAAFFAALLLGRRAISMRTVAVSAFVVLAMKPESVVMAGFQMSFAAAAALVAAFTWLRDRRPAYYITPDWMMGPRRFVSALVVSSLVAGLATGGLAAFHFNRMAVYGFWANLAAMPVFSLGVMPAGAFALALMPVGLEGVPLWVMNKTMAVVMDIAEWTSARPGALAPMPAGAGGALPVYALGFALAAAMKGAWRLLGFMVMAGAIAFWAGAERPHLVITEGGVAVARFETAQGEEGGWAVSDRRRSRFAAAAALQRAGVQGAPGSEGLSCDAAGCTGRVRGLLVALPQTAEAVAEDCRTADLVIARDRIAPLMRAQCGARLLDARARAREGAMEFWISDGRITRIRSVESARGARPWTAGEGAD
ncbi:MAG: ComEC/Rec2 family competence protein [Maricaulaceae bacterium]|nr:ComEC/Rec2 family competence protein [Maricaulaceae bacterium]